MRIIVIIGFCCYCMGIALSAEPAQDAALPLNYKPGIPWDSDPLELVLSSRDSRPMPLRKPTQFFDPGQKRKNLAGFKVGYDEKLRVTLFDIYSQYSKHTDTYASLPICFSMQFEVQDNQVFPIYNELYKITKLFPGQKFTLTRISADVPNHYLPLDGAKTVAMNSPHSRFTYDKQRKTYGYVTLKSISPTEDDKEFRATFDVVTPEASQNKLTQDFETSKPEMSHEVILKVGDTLECGQQKSKIAKILPPTLLDPLNPNRGKLVGWVEFVPETIPHPKKD